MQMASRESHLAAGEPRRGGCLHYGQGTRGFLTSSPPLRRPSCRPFARHTVTEGRPLSFTESRAIICWPLADRRRRTRRRNDRSGPGPFSQEESRRSRAGVPRERCRGGTRDDLGGASRVVSSAWTSRELARIRTGVVCDFLFFFSSTFYIPFYFAFYFFFSPLPSCRGSRTKVSGRVSAAVDTLGVLGGREGRREDGRAINIELE